MECAGEWAQRISPTSRPCRQRESSKGTAICSAGHRLLSVLSENESCWRRPGKGASPLGAQPMVIAGVPGTQIDIAALESDTGKLHGDERGYDESDQPNALPR